MPRSRNNGAFRGGRAFQHFNSNQSTALATNSISEGDLDHLAEVFTSVDKDVIYVVLLECAGDVHTATERLFEILGESSHQVTGEENDLALIACSLLSEDSSHGIKTNILDETVPRGLDLGGLNSTVTEEEILQLTVSSESDTDLLVAHGEGALLKNTERKAWSMSSRSKNLDSQKFGLGNQPYADTICGNYSKDNRKCDILVNNNNMEETKKLESERKQSVVQNLPLLHRHTEKKFSSLDFNVKKVVEKQFNQSPSLNTSGLASEEWMKSYESCDFLSDGEEYRPISMDELERKTFGHLSGLLKSGFDQQPQSIKGLKSGKKESSLERNKEKRENSSTVESGKKRGKGKKNKNKSRKGQDVTMSVTDASVEVKGNDSDNHSYEKSSFLSRQNISTDYSSSSKNTMEGFGSKKDQPHSKSCLSPTAAEFIPMHQSRPLAEDSLRSGKTQNGEPPKPLKFLPLTLGGKTKNKSQNKMSSDPPIEATVNLDHLKDSCLLSEQTLSFSEVVIHPDNPETISPNEMIFDPTDPLGWNDIFQNTSYLFSNPKPQRLQSMKRTSDLPVSKPSTELSSSPAIQFNNESIKIPVRDIRSSPSPDTGSLLSSSSGSPSSHGKCDVMQPLSESGPKIMKQKDSPVPAVNVLTDKLNAQEVKSPEEVLQLYFVEKKPVMLILRGLPGSGKSYLANWLIKEGCKMNVKGVILSSDDFFMKGNQYCYNKNEIGSAHDWNKKRALGSVKAGTSPIIIDNTNTELWELLPYAVMALEHKYDIQLLEPQTQWKFKMKELAKRNGHGVPKEQIRRMKDRYQKITLDDVLEKARLAVKTRISNFNTPTAPSAQSSLEENNFQKAWQTGTEFIKSSSATLAKQDMDFSDSGSEQPLSQRLKGKKEHLVKIVKKEQNCEEDSQKDFRSADKIKTSFTLMSHDADKSQSNKNGELCPSKGGNNFQTTGLAPNRLLSIKMVSSQLNSSCSTVDSFKTCYSGNESFSSTKCESSDSDTDGSDPLADVKQQFKRDICQNGTVVNALSCIENEEEAEKEEEKTPASVGESQPHSFQTQSKNKCDLSKDSMKPEVKAENCDSPQSANVERIWQSSQLSMLDEFFNSKFTTSTQSMNQDAGVGSTAEESECDDLHEPSVREAMNMSSSSPLVEYSDSASEDDNSASQELGRHDEAKTVKSDALNTVASSEEEYSTTDQSAVCSDKEDGASGNGKVDKLITPILNSEISDNIQTSTSPYASSKEHSPPVVPSVTISEINPTLRSRKKKKNRIRKGRATGPFLEESVKAISKTIENWKSMLDEHVEGTGISTVCFQQVKKSPQAVQVSQSTQCDPYYFSIVHKLNSPAFNSLQPADFSYGKEKVVISISNRAISPECDARFVSMPFDTIDKSTVTDETLEQDEVDLETMQNCFPEYTRKSLEELLNIYDNDLEWVTNHLLDSPALFDMEEDDRERNYALALTMTDRDSAASDHSVKSLASLCSTVVKNTIKIDEDDLEMQVIQAGQTRLNSIERYGWARLHGSQDHWPDDFSLDHFSGTVTQEECWDWVPPHSATPEYRPTPPTFKISPSSKSIIYAIEPRSPQKEFLTTLMSEKQFTMCPIKDKPEFSSPYSPILQPLATLKDAVPADPSEVKTFEPQSRLSMPAELVRQLETLYGSLNLNFGEEGFILDDKTARKIHKCLKLQSLNKIVIDPKKQVEKDEAWARQLQEEERHNQVHSNQQSTHSLNLCGSSANVPGWSGQRPPWMSQTGALPSQTEQSYWENQKSPKVMQNNTVSGTLYTLRGTKGKARKSRKFQPRMPVAQTSAWQGVKKRGNTDSFQSIMEEEIAQEERIKEEVRISEIYGDTNVLATKMKRQKLMEMFPSLGPEILEEVFRSTGFSQDMTVKMLTELYNIVPAPMSKEKEEEIIIMAKQRSKTDFDSVPQGHNEYIGQSPSHGSEMTYDGLRNEAQFYHRLANDCKEQAHRYHSDGMQGAALFYRQQIKKYKEEEHAANHRAAQFLYERGRERLEKENTLDLHFFHLDEAILAVNDAISGKEEDYKMKPDRKNSYLNIVTGRGRNSKDGIPKLKPAIMNHLRDKGLRFEEKTSGMLRVYLGSRIYRDN